MAKKAKATGVRVAHHAPKKPRKAKTKADAPGAAGAAEAAEFNGDNGGPKLTSVEEHDLFLQHRTSWNAWQAKVKALELIERDVKAALKADGFTVRAFVTADKLMTVKGEKLIKEHVGETLRVARWLGLPMGAQLDLFEGAAMTVERSVDQWFIDGREASTHNLPRKPPDGLAHGSPPHDAWFAGYDEHQAKLAGEVGRGPVEQEAGERVSREEFNRRLQEQAQTTPDGSPL